jgi:sporulation protein YlmC with PRC-barrel domain
MELGTRTTHDMIESDKIDGTAVFNRDDERIGSIDHLVIDKHSGQVEYAVLAFGGLFGLGHKHYPLPWDALTYDTDKGGFVVDISKDKLEDAPSYESKEDRPSYDEEYGQQVYGYYGFTY